MKTFDKKLAYLDRQVFPKKIRELVLGPKERLSIRADFILPVDNIGQMIFDQLEMVSQGVTWK